MYYAWHVSLDVQLPLSRRSIVWQGRGSKHSKCNCCAKLLKNNIIMMGSRCKWTCYLDGFHLEFCYGIFGNNKKSFPYTVIPLTNSGTTTYLIFIIADLGLSSFVVGCVLVDRNFPSNKANDQYYMYITKIQILTKGRGPGRDKYKVTNREL